MPGGQEAGVQAGVASQRWVGQGAGLTLVLSSLVLGHRGRVGEELEADVTLDQGLELPGVAGEHLRVVGSVVVPQARQLLRQQCSVRAVEGVWVCACSTW